MKHKAERKLVQMGEQGRVRESRTAFQAATEEEFIEAIEAIVERKVRSFASGIDPDNNTVFETFCFEPKETVELEPPLVAVLR